MHDHIARYLAAREARGIAPRTLYQDRYHLDDFARSVDKPPSEIRVEDIEDYLVDCRHLAVTTRRVRRATLHAFFGWLHGRGVVAANPVSGVAVPRVARKQPTYYEPEQAARLLQGIADPRDRLLAIILLRHGQRIASVLALRWEQVDLDKARISYPPHKGGPPLRLALDLDTARQLKAWKALARSEWVFPGYNGGHLSYTRAYRNLRDAARRAGLQWRGAHEFRRTCITTLLQMGEPLHVVSARVAGHSNVATTTRYYAGVDDEDVGAAIRRLPY